MYSTSPASNLVRSSWSLRPPTKWTPTAFSISVAVGVAPDCGDPFARQVRNSGGRHVAALAAHQHEAVFQVRRGEHEVPLPFGGAPHGRAAIVGRVPDTGLHIPPIDDGCRRLDTGSLKRGVHQLHCDPSPFGRVCKGGPRVGRETECGGVGRQGNAGNIRSHPQSRERIAPYDVVVS